MLACLWQKSSIGKNRKSTLCPRKGETTFCMGKFLKGLTVLVISPAVVIHLNAYL
jgi:hypothetical protein